VDTIKERHDGLTARLGTVISTLNNIVKKIKETKECYTKCGKCSGQRKGLEHLPLKNWEFVFTWFQQATARHAVISGTLLKERLHIATGTGSEDSPPLMAGSATVCEETYWDNKKSLHLTRQWLWWGSLNGEKNSKQTATILLAHNVNGTDKHPSLVTGNREMKTFVALQLL